MRHLFLLLLFFMISELAVGQEDCASSVSITVGSNIAANNNGALPDNDYSSITSCNPASYAAAVWYDFTVPAGVSSINMTFTTGSIGPDALVTIVDGCSFPVGVNVIWFSCDAVGTSGTVETLCNLSPGATYYIQVASSVGSEGTFTIDLALNPSSPSNDICELATDLGVMDCMGGFGLDFFANSSACPDPANGGGCVAPPMGGVWYTFTTPASIEYAGASFGGGAVPGNYVVFSTPNDCSNLTMVFDCTMGPFYGGWQNNTTYYVLVGIHLIIHPFQSIMTNTCFGPDPEMNTGNGTGESDWGFSSCINDDPVEPCYGENVIWWSYTVGCTDANLQISVEPFTNSSTQGFEIDDSGIAVFETDCSTLMSQYDPNGLGYVCSSVILNEELSLVNVPAGTQFLIAIASADPDQGYFEVFVSEVPVGGAGLTNDDCVDAEPLVTGINIELNNFCANPDLAFPSCPLQSESTVWYEYDAGPSPVDLSFDITPMGIINPAMALYDGCNGSLLDHICGTFLELTCAQGLIIVQIGSSEVSEGQFDLTVSSSPAMAPPPINLSPPGICSNNMADILLELPPGEIGDIYVTVSPSSSPDILGAQNHDFLNVSSGTIADVLINCSTTVQNAVYEVTSVIPGFSCASMITEITIPVYPKLEANPPIIEECLPFDLTLDADLIVTGGTSPYTSYLWQWNGTTIGSNNELMAYPLFMDGLITLDVTDANNCTIQTTIDVITHPQFFPIIQSSTTSACPGDPQIISVNLDLSTVTDGLSSSTWVVTDQLGLPVSLGTPTSDTYIIDTENVAPGVYTIYVDVVNSFGCVGTSNEVDITIHPTAEGILSLEYDINCNAQINVLFYGPGGTDIYNNGPDSNGDGLPDSVDSDNNGVIDFMLINWHTPTQTIANGSLSLNPTESGNHYIVIIMDNGCTLNIADIDVLLSPPIPPSIIVPADLCEGDEILIEAAPMSYSSYLWTNQNGTVLGNGPSVIVNVDTVSIIYLEVLDGGGCMHMASEMIDVGAIPEIMLSGSLTICPGQTTTISAGGDPLTWTYQWFDDAMTLLGSDSSSIIIDTPGTYTSIVSNANNCTDTLSFSIEENAQLSIQISGGDFCQGDSVFLDAGNDFDSYSWMDQAGMTISDQQSFWTMTPGLYVVQVTKEMCDGIDSIEIEMIIPPQVEIPETIEVCSQNNMNLSTTLDFNDLASTSDAGDWVSLDLPGTILIDLSSVDFDAIAPGQYAFSYTTNMAMAPCPEEVDTLLVTVQDCDCPFVEVNDQLTLCNTQLEYDLDLEINPLSEAGSWVFINGPENVVVPVSNVIGIQGLLGGMYSFEFVLDDSPPAPCVDADTLTLLIESEPEIILDGPVTVCNTVSPQAPVQVNLIDFILIGNGDWVDPMISNLDFSDPSDLSFFNVTPGSYAIDFISNDAVAPCAEVIESITVTVLDCNCPIIDLQPIPDQCNDGSIIDLSIYQGISDPGTWSADVTNPVSITINNNEIELTNRPIGSYQFIYTLDNDVPGCPLSDVVVIQLVAPPTISSIIDTTACMSGEETVVDLTQLINANAGTWTDGSGSQVSDPTQVDFEGLDVGSTWEFIYTTTTATPPCQNVSASLFITVEDCSCDDPVFLDPPILCNSPDGVVDLEDLLLSSHTGIWSIIEQPVGENMSLVGTVFNSEDIKGGMYVIQFSLSEITNPDCQEDWVMTLSVLEESNAQVLLIDEVCTTQFNGDITVYNLNDAVADQSESGYWVDDNGNTLSNTVIDFLGAEEGSYFFTYIIENQLPCASHQYSFELMATECSIEKIDTDIYVGNAFSPNGDNLNDHIFVQSNITDLLVRSFSIYDRWGERVFFAENFTANDPSNGWNGRFKNEWVGSGVYVYLIEVADASGSLKRIAGDITILR